MKSWLDRGAKLTGAMALICGVVSCGEAVEGAAASEEEVGANGDATNSMPGGSMPAVSDGESANDVAGTMSSPGAADSDDGPVVPNPGGEATATDSAGNDPAESSNVGDPGDVDDTDEAATDSLPEPDPEPEPEPDPELEEQEATELEWRCVEFDGAPDWFCACEERAPGTHAADMTMERCEHTAYPCCVAEPLTGECVCDYTADCADKAAFANGVEVASCPPEQDTDDLEDLLPADDEPVCNGGTMSCGQGSPRCDNIDGSCPLCFVCQDANLKPSCTAPDDDLLVLGVPDCLEVPASDISPESGQAVCVASIVSYTFDGDRSITYGQTCVDPANHASVSALPACTEDGAIPHCDMFEMSCVLLEERDLPPEERTVLGDPVCQAF